MHHGGKECYWQLKQILDVAHIIRRYPDLDYWVAASAGRKISCNRPFLPWGQAGVRTDRGECTQPFAGQIVKKRIAIMAGSSIRLAAKPVNELKTIKGSWHHGYSRSVRATVEDEGASLPVYVTQNNCARMVPGKWRHLFFNRKNRRSYAV